MGLKSLLADLLIKKPFAMKVDHNVFKTDPLIPGQSLTSRNCKNSTTRPTEWDYWSKTIHKNSSLNPINNKNENIVGKAYMGRPAFISAHVYNL